MYPALAVLQVLKDKTTETLWVGSQSGMEENLLGQHEIPFRSISAAGVHGISFWNLPKNILALINGWKESKAILKNFQPQVIFYTGGYIGVPMALAAGRTPSVVFIPDIEPGLALKIILRSSNHTAVSTGQTLPYLSRPTSAQVTGYPLRKEIMKWNRNQGRKHFNIPTKAKTLLVYGGSKGARSLNKALLPVLNKLCVDFHIIHITGVDNWEDVQKEMQTMSVVNPQNYHSFPFLHNDMGAAFAAADLAVCRAGASTIGELPYFGLPAILVPYPYAWQYQHQNAEFLSRKGGAVIMKDEEMEQSLYDTIISIISDSKKHKAMKKSMKNIAKEDAAESIANLILEAAQIRNSGGN